MKKSVCHTINFYQRLQYELELEKSLEEKRQLKIINEELNRKLIEVCKNPFKDNLSFEYKEIYQMEIQRLNQTLERECRLTKTWRFAFYQLAKQLEKENENVKISLVSAQALVLLEEALKKIERYEKEYRMKEFKRQSEYSYGATKGGKSNKEFSVKTFFSQLKGRIEPKQKAFSVIQGAEIQKEIDNIGKVEREDYDTTETMDTVSSWEDELYTNVEECVMPSPENELSGVEQYGWEEEPVKMPNDGIEPSCREEEDWDLDEPALPIQEEGVEEALAHSKEINLVTADQRTLLDFDEEGGMTDEVPEQHEEYFAEEDVSIETEGRELEQVVEKRDEGSPPLSEEDDEDVKIINSEQILYKKSDPSLLSEEKSNYEEILYLIEKNEQLKNLSEQEKEKVAKKMREITYYKNSSVIIEGEKSDGLYLIGKGKVSISYYDGAGQPLTSTKELGIGEIFGQRTYQMDEHYPCYVIAKSHLTLYKIIYSDIEELSFIENINDELGEEIRVERDVCKEQIMEIMNEIEEFKGKKVKKLAKDVNTITLDLGEEMLLEEKGKKGLYVVRGMLRSKKNGVKYGEKTLIKPSEEGQALIAIDITLILEFSLHILEDEKVDQGVKIEEAGIKEAGHLYNTLLKINKDNLNQLEQCVITPFPDKSKLSKWLISCFEKHELKKDSEIVEPEIFFIESGKIKKYEFDEKGKQIKKNGVEKKTVIGMELGNKYKYIVTSSKAIVYILPCKKHELIKTIYEEWMKIKKRMGKYEEINGEKNEITELIAKREGEIVEEVCLNDVGKIYHIFRGN